MRPTIAPSCGPAPRSTAPTAQAGLLLRFQSDPACLAALAVVRRAVDARASPLPGRLADALLRFRAARNLHGERHVVARRRSEAGLGARASGRVPDRFEPRAEGAAAPRSGA